MQTQPLWKIIDRPGYLGKKKQQKHQEWNDTYGENQWRLGWHIGQTTADLLGACALYEDAYFEFLKNNPNVLEMLIREASNVYDDEPSNVNSGFDYTKQETRLTHLQDIAIRKSVLRLGKWFQGTELIRIRQEKGNHELSMTLSPGRVPFHLPNLIVQPELEGWWDKGSVESFYQSNRFLEVVDKGYWIGKKLRTFVYLYRNLDDLLVWLGDHEHTGIGLTPHLDKPADLVEGNPGVIRVLFLTEEITRGEKYKVWGVYHDNSTQVLPPSIPIDGRDLKPLWKEIWREDKKTEIADPDIKELPVLTDHRSYQCSFYALF